jgi:hypothetical protein
VAIKAGQILHDAKGSVIDRIQTGGVSNLNIPEERIYELGNFETVATIRDTPDLSFDLESFDVSTEIEALLLNKTPSAITDGQELDLTQSVPMDVISPFKSAFGAYDIVRGVALPYLTLESATYRFGVRQNSTQAFTLRGDSVFYIPGTPYYQEFTVSGTGPYTLTNTAVVYNEGGDALYALGVCLKNSTTNAYKRLFFGTDYTNSSTAVTLTASPDAAYNRLCVVYGSTTAATYAQTVHQGTAVKPAAVRGRDIDVYVSDGAATPTFTRWTDVQSFEINYRVNLDNDEEFGNPRFVAQDYDTPEVGGNITIKARTPQDLFTKIRQVANVSSTEVVGPTTSIALGVELRISHPDTGARLKTLYIPDARFTIPSIQGQVQQKLTTQFNFTSDSGSLSVFKATR